MPMDEAKLRRAARDAAYTSSEHLKEVQRRLQAVRGRFDGRLSSGVGLASWRSLGTHLEQRRGEEFVAAYQQLVEALKKADAAVEQALQATTRMRDAAR